MDTVCAILEAVERSGLWPSCLLQMLVAMIDKPKGGLRPVTLFASLFRVWAKVRRPAADEWKQANDREYLIFGKGASPEQAVWRQAVKAEAVACRTTGTAGSTMTPKVRACAATCLFDLRKYYEMIPLDVLEDRARRAGLPRSLVRCCLAMHRAPRFLRRGQALHAGRFCARLGVPAGCVFADLWTMVHATPQHGPPHVGYPAGCVPQDVGG